MTTLDFSDLEAQDPIFGNRPRADLTVRPLPADPSVFVTARRDTRMDATGAEAGMHRETCWKCGGTGAYRGYSSYGNKCFECKGAGYKLFRQDRATREKNREQSKARKARRMDESWAAFAEAEPAVAAWMQAASARGFNFAASLQEAVRKYGELTDNQRAAVEKCMARDAERDAQRAKTTEQRAQEQAAAPECDARRLADSMLHAKAAGLKYVSLELDPFAFALAPDHGKNPGAIYVTLGRGRGKPYLGKVLQGKFLRSRECTDEQQLEVLKVCADPFKAAVAHGLQTGRCSCCGRELTNKESVELGIGPICREKFGW